MEDHKQHNLDLPNPSDNPQSPDLQSMGNILRIDKNLNVKNKFIVSDKEVSNLLGQRFKRTLFSTLLTGSVYSAATNDYLIGITSLSYAPSVGLPSPKLVGAGKTYIIKDEVGGAATTNITIRSALEETIDGAATSTINTNYGIKEFYSDGANWFTK